MPYNSVGGFPPLATQVARGTVYEPKQDMTFLNFQRAQLRNLNGAPTLQQTQESTYSPTPSSSSSSQDVFAVKPTKLPNIATNAKPSEDTQPRTPMPPARKDVALQDALTGETAEHHTGGNPWSVRTTLAELEERRQTNLHGVAAFRPIRYRTLAFAEQQTLARAPPATYPSSDESSSPRAAVASPTPSSAVPASNSNAMVSSTGVKPLLEPFLNAQELAQQASEETWHTRRLRYLQWLRKGALTAKKKQEEKAERENEISPLPGDLLSYVSRPALMGGGDVAPWPPTAAVEQQQQHWRSHGSAGHPLVPLDHGEIQQHSSQGQDVAPAESTRVFGKSDVNSYHHLQGSRLEESALARFQPVAFAPNPNEVAVRQLFRMARGEDLTPLNSPTASRKNEKGVGGASAGVEREEDAGATSARRGSSAAISHLPAQASTMTHVPTFGDGRVYLDEDGFSFSPALRDDDDDGDAASDDDGADTASTTSKSIIDPPPEYAVAGLLRKRMHNTVAVFTASAAHTLDTPPRKATRKLLGQARLQSHDDFADQRSFGCGSRNDGDTNGAAGRRLIRGTQEQSVAAESMQNGIPTSDKDRVLAQEKIELPQQQRFLPVTRPRQPRPLSTRTVRRLLYEEAYERGLLSQLAFQSSPTRWYSSELPSGQDGIAFRKVYAPTMQADEVLQARLDAATAHAVQSIALPRREAAAAMAERHQQYIEALAQSSGLADSSAYRRRLMAGTTTSGEDGSETLINLAKAAGLTVDDAAREKAVLFEQWTRLHRNLSAQWQLRREEQAERLLLLGHFVSCKYPAPCICLECDQEVLNMSAIPLEPTVKPLCWYTSVVLCGHHDVLQKEMLRQHEEGLTAMYAEFRVLFIATYTREKLLEEEGRRFQKMMRYHEFCLRVAAQSHTTTKAVGEENGVAADENGEGGDASGIVPLLDVTAEEPEQDAQSLRGTDPRMWRLRQRRLQAYKAFDSPFFSYLVYTEMTTVASAEEQVREMLVEEETSKRRELMTLLQIDEQFSTFLALERRQRSWIFAEMVEAHSAMLTGPLVQLHAAHMAELRENEAAAYARVCSREQQIFVAAAVAEKQAAAEANYAAFKLGFRELRQELLTFLVANRSAAGSVELSRNWLWEQQQNVLIRTEQRLRDQLVLHEEPAAFQDAIEAAAHSKVAAGEQEAERRVREDADAVAAAAEAARASRDAQADRDAESRRQRAWEEMKTDPRLRPSAKLPDDAANDFNKLTTALNEDFMFYLAELD